VAPIAALAIPSAAIDTPIASLATPTESIRSTFVENFTSRASLHTPSESLAVRTAAIVTLTAAETPSGARVENHADPGRVTATRHSSPITSR
jgi:hypothetical protein